MQSPPSTAGLAAERYDKISRDDQHERPLSGPRATGERTEALVVRSLDRADNRHPSAQFGVHPRFSDVLSVFEADKVHLPTRPDRLTYLLHHSCQGDISSPPARWTFSRMALENGREVRLSLEANAKSDLRERHICA